MPGGRKAENDTVDTVAPARPVFVDSAGRRARWSRRIGAVAVAGALAYLAGVAASLAGTPWVPQLNLPVVGHVLPGADVKPRPGAGPAADPAPPPGPTAVAGAVTPINGSSRQTSTGTLPAPSTGQGAGSVAPSVAGAAAPGTSAAVPATATGTPRRTTSSTAAGSTSTTTPPTQSAPTSTPGHSGSAPGQTKTSVSTPSATAPGHVKH